ncbi:hypothetical protein GSI_04263 [Ganoderma sinense ZZ0214-1]|uniref:DUF6534 domain-containing protein n=1 Tax=Ganoderma sinense ZZ0214-1 TaxID=1077348 RepID=A0A2G8SIR3_9APHY|nr:hypothetical protein GSI_04263 [Ganoderma sinense ZZ0214-1]
MAAFSLAGIDLGSTLGVTFLGVALSSMIYGITCLQTFIYYRSPRAKTDGAILRSLVATVFLCESFHQVVILHATYHYLILGFARPLSLITTLVWSLPMETIMNGILSLLLFSFLTHRLWLLSRHAYLSACGALLTVVSVAVTTAYGIRGFRYCNLFQAEKVLRTHGILSLSISLGADLFISTSLCYYLHRSRTGWRKSDDIITKLIALTITTGMLTTLCKLVDLIAEKSPALFRDK